MNSLKSLRNKTDLKKAAPAILLVLNSFVWYIMAYAVFLSVVNGLQSPETEKLEIFATYFATVAVMAIIGSKYLPRVRTKSLYLWPFLGAITTLLLSALSNQNLLINALIAFSLGTSIGIGLPSCLSYFAESTSLETRGFAGGLTWSGVGITVLPFAFFLAIQGNWQAIILLAIWRLLGGIGFIGLDRKYKKQPNVQKSPSYFELIQKRDILLYLFPWTMFSIINFAETPILQNVFGQEAFLIIQLAEFAIIGIFAVMGGIVADISGRKRVVIAGFVMLGIEYAVMSLFSSSPLTVYLFLALDGITWGLLVSVFFTVIWGDLGENGIKEKYYTLGGLPYLLSSFLSILIEPYAKHIPSGTAFSLASFFLFMAVIPLMYAHETLPEKAIKDRDLKSYLEKAQRLVQKETEKKEKQGKEKTKEENEEAKEKTQESPEDEEARKLAEKYY
ncbi:MAG: MFS transporter [Candidatus Bathyarchaeia archaeon]|jgi:MFS family permease